MTRAKFKPLKMCISFVFVCLLLLLLLFEFPEISL